MSIFEKIVKKEIHSEILYEDNNFIVINDLKPVAPIHLLIIPKKKFKNLDDIQEDNMNIFCDLIKVVQIMAKKHGIAGGYRLLTNCGEKAGQSIFYLHFHLIGGKRLDNLC